MLRGPNLGTEPGLEYEGEPWRAPDPRVVRDASGRVPSCASPSRSRDGPVGTSPRRFRRLEGPRGYRLAIRVRRPMALADLSDPRLPLRRSTRHRSHVGDTGSAPPDCLGSLGSSALSGPARPVARTGSWSPSLSPSLCSWRPKQARLHIRGAHRYASWTRDVGVCAQQVRSWTRVRDIALAVHAEDSVRRGLEAAQVTADLTAGRRERDSERESRGSQPSVLIKRGWPRRVRGFAAAAPRLGTVTARVKFGGIVLEVGPDIFVPRGLAESLAAEAARVLGSGPGVVVDVGTGCGPVALAVASAAPEAEIHATEISRRALFWAARNRRRLGASRVHFHRGSLLDPLPERLRGRVRVMTANVPYVPLEQWQDGWRGRESQVVGPDAGWTRALSPAGARRPQIPRSGWPPAPPARRSPLGILPRGAPHARVSPRGRPPAMGL